MEDKVSIIVPVYNTPVKFLDECIMSIVEQTYKNLEIIIVDDGSNLETANDCDKYLKRDKRIRVIHQQNQGVSMARNKGVENATGKWIAFIDADDWYEKEAIETLARRTEEADIIIGNMVIDNQHLKTIRESGVLTEDERKELISSMFLDNNIKFNGVASACAKLYSKKFIINEKIQMDKKLIIGEDFIFNLEAYIKAKKIIFLKDNIYHYRTNNDSVMRKFDDKIIQKYDVFYAKIEERFKREIEENFEYEYYYYAIRQINRFCTKYIFSKENDMVDKEKFKILESITKKEPYKTALNVISIKSLSFKQKLIVLSIRYKKYGILKKIYELNTLLKDKHVKCK